MLQVDRTLAIIDESPSFLQDIKGIGARRLQRIRQSWQEQKAVRAIMVFLQSYGIGTARVLPASHGTSWSRCD